MTIRLTDDELITDEALAEEWQTTTRTLRRYDAQSPGLPFVMLSGRKWRPVKACQQWLAKRVRQPNPKRAA